jgi:hypothetical protein
MAKVKSYMNPNIPKPNPKPGDSSGEGRVTIPRQPRPGPLTPRTPGAPGKREKRPLPNPKPFDLRKEKQLPRKFSPETRKKSGDMGSTARNKRFPSPKPKPKRRGAR